jgi:preprotein translocase SecY subunit
MFRRFLLVFTDPELRLKLTKIILLLTTARILAHVPIPLLGISDISAVIDSDAIFGLLNTISGGAYGRLSFVMLGIGPYITASIVMQLMGVIVPKIKEIQKEEGEQGKQKINRWTRFLTVPLSALNAWGIMRYLSSDPQTSSLFPESFTNSSGSEAVWSWFIVIGSLTAGSIIMMWIGELISEYKMGNGISLLILSGIVVRLPDQLVFLSQELYPDVQELFGKFTLEKASNLDVWKAFIWQNPQWELIRSTVMFAVIFVVTLMLVVYINDAVRKLKVVYSRRGHAVGNSRTLGKVTASLPVKVNIAGIIPIIFAISFILFPTIVARFFITSNMESLYNTANTVTEFLSTEQRTNPETGVPIAEPDNLPTGFMGFYYTTDADKMNAAVNYDPTLGQELLGFTISTQEQVKTSLFEGTFFNLQVDGTNFGVLPEFSFRFSGILAYNLFYFLLVIFFTYFYTNTIAFKTDDVAENLQKSGAYIPGYRPGPETESYLSYVSNRLNVAGSIFLASIAIAPILMGSNVILGDLNYIVGGTTILILVSVTIESMRQIEAQATAVDYDRFTKY